jgi:aryl-phospho-beta-D-glucosidase BglC (GH1 family)
MKKVILLSLLLSCIFSRVAEGQSKVFEINKQLGRGINIGNTFEAPSEEAWGNPWNPAYIKMIADLGFRHIRLPIRWEPSERSMTEAPYTISAEFLARIKSVVDAALAQKLPIIINMHHHEALYKDPEGQHARFLSQWRQIADYFKSYPDRLLFEILNEPHDQLNVERWNQYMKEALTEIRKTNPERVVLIGTAEWGGIGALRKLEWPDDNNLILTIHYYNPFNFTHQGAEWSEGMRQVKDVEWHDTEAERMAVRKDFAAVQAFAEKQQTPVHVGEFGAYCKADPDSRVRWTTYLARFFEERGYSWAYWEFSAGFGIYNPRTETFLQPLVDALLHNPMPKPVLAP